MDPKPPPAAPGDKRPDKGATPPPSPASGPSSASPAGAPSPSTGAPSPSTSAPSPPSAAIPPAHEIAAAASVAPDWRAKLPAWAADGIALYESGSSNQFVLHGNVQDRLLLPLADGPRLGSLEEFILRVLLPSYDVVLTYDLGNGVQVERGGELLTDWPSFKEKPELPKAPRAAVEFLTYFFRYCANLGRLGRRRIQVGLVVRAADLLVPAQAGSSHEMNALALLIRGWSADELLLEHPLVTFLLVGNLNDLHPLLANNTRAAQIAVPLPTEGEIESALRVLVPQSPTAMSEAKSQLAGTAAQLRGATLASVESLLKTSEYRREPLRMSHLSEHKKRLVEKDCHGLIDFMSSGRSLDELQGLDAVKAWLRQDLELWRLNDIEALPKGYLFCGPVGTGKTFLVECLAGEAGVPVVRLKNFRDRWVGSTEGNLETIFRLIHALGRCFVFIDEADQALGQRESGSGDSGLSGRVYAMIAEEMGNSRNRGRIVWILASSRPDLIEVDLKRPGRVDVKIPLLPSATPEEGFHLLQKLLGRRGLVLDGAEFAAVAARMPALLTPGAAEALAVKIYRSVRTANLSVGRALAASLEDYRLPVPLEVLEAQISLAVREATDIAFVPEPFRKYAGPGGGA